HGAMDQEVLAAYGWSDVPQVGPCHSHCGFGLDYLDTEDDAQLPDQLQERIGAGSEMSGDLFFFWDPGDALDFQGQLQAYGAITGRRKLPWRDRWPDAVRDDVLARLLALNAERYAEEVAQGLHGKAGKKPAADPAAGGKRRGRPARSADSTDTEQIGLAL
ncbi:MAG: SAM-dependent methyltransferase, partial [Cyanobacteriota bacterium]